MMEEKAEISPRERWQQIKQEYRRTLSATIRSRAAWFFIVVQFAAFVILALKGNFDIILSFLPYILFILIFVLLTIPLTVGVEQLPPVETRCSRRQLWWQVVILLVVILLAVYRSFIINVPGALHIPLFYPLFHPSSFLNAELALSVAWLTVPVLYFLIPAALLLLLGASWSELGLGRGYRSWRATLLWSFLPLLVITILLVTAAISLANVGLKLLGNILQNGFFEEFLFRGALMTRLSYLIHSDWGLVLSSLIFGLIHIGTRISFLHGDWLASAASTITDQAILGLGMAIIYLRTRNLLASSIFHVLLDTVG